MKLNDLLLTSKFGLCVITAVLLAGCSTPGKELVSYEDLDEFRVDCRRKQEQLSFLYSQIPSRTHQELASANIVSFSNSNHKVATGAYKRKVEAWIDEVHRRCIS